MVPYHFTSIETERLRLRPMRLEDAEAVHAYQGREDVCEYLMYTPRTLEQVREKMAERAAHRDLVTDGDCLQPAVEHRQSGRLLGEMYFELRSTELRTGEIGWVLHPDEHGHGYATEAARAMLALAFEQMRLHRVVARLAPQNTASVALCARLGMRAEAHFVQDIWVKGGWEDTCVHAILSEEWNAVRSRAPM